MIYTTKKKHQSKLKGYEEVFFTLRKMSEGRRIKLRLAMAEHYGKIREIDAKLSPLQAKIPEGGNAKEVLAQDFATALNLLDEQSDTIAQINVAWLKWGLDSIEGLKDGDNKDIGTADALIEDGPPELYKEIVDVIQSEASMTDEETKN